MALPKDVKFVTFDCYGTLIDWESGVYDAFQMEADRDGFTIDRDVLIPRFIGVYTYHLNNTSRITDAPTIRALTFILQDEFDTWRDGEMLLQSLIDTPEKAERAARRYQELETLYLASGGIAGPGSLGEPAQEVPVG